MTISDACGAKHVNLRKMSYPACRSRHAIYRALSSVLSRAARSTNAWWRRAIYANVFPSRWAVTVLDWLISLSWRRSFIPSMLTSHSPCSPRCSGLRRWWLAANQSSTNGFCRPFLRPRVHRLPHSLRPNPAAAPTSDLYRQEKASAPLRGGLATRGSSRAGSNGNLLGQEGGGLQLAAESFARSGALVCIFGVALMRAAFQFALSFAKSEKRGGIQQIIQHQAVGYALADAKTTIEAARVLSWHACRALDTAAPGALELAIHAKVFGSEAAVRVITNLMQVVGVDSYGHELPLAGLLQDAMALPLFAGGNIGVRRRQLHALMLDPAYDDLATLDGICLAETVP